MQRYKSFKDTSKLYQITREEQTFPQRKLEPISTREVTERVVTTVDKKYKTSDLSLIVSDNCSRLDCLQQVNC